MQPLHICGGLKLVRACLILMADRRGHPTVLSRNDPISLLSILPVGSVLWKSRNDERTYAEGARP